MKMIEGSWCIVNEKKEECRPLFSEMAINATFMKILSYWRVRSNGE